MPKHCLADRKEEFLVPLVQKEGASRIVGLVMLVDVDYESG